jgi:quercetin dioxygenase-like cupin family protein
MSTSWSATPLERLRHHVTGAVERGEAEPITERSVLAEVIVLNGRPTFKVTHRGYLVGKGFFATIPAVTHAVEGIGLTMADVHIKETA